MRRNAIIITAVLIVLGASSGCTRRPTHNATNVLLIILDTVRADRLSCYGHNRPTTPNLDQIASRGVRFENFYANSSWTLASHASLFTGLYPAAHRATQETLRLSDGPTTLAEVFGKAGYQTFGASTNSVVSKSSGLARGFDEFVEVFRSEYKTRVTEEGKGGHINNIAFEDFLSGSDRDRPFFAFVNYIAAHLPYAPVEPHRSQLLDANIRGELVARGVELRMTDHYQDESVTDEDFNVLSQLYDGELNFLDQYVADLLAALYRDGRLSNTLVVITSDHGENIGDHGHFAHVFNVYNTLLRIPLIVVFPDQAQAGQIRRDTSQLLDLFPTILRYCGISYDAPPAGRDLFARNAESEKPVIMAEYYYPRQVLSVFDSVAVADDPLKFVPFMRRLRTVQNSDMKLIVGSDGAEELYRVSEDPYETSNLIDHFDQREQKEVLSKTLSALLKKHHGDTPIEPPPPVGWMVEGFEDVISDPELLEQLRALGYIK